MTFVKICGDGYSKYCPLPVLTFYCDISFMLFYDGIADGKAQACSLADSFSCEERIKNMGKVLRLNTCACVADLYDDHLVDLDKVDF